MIAADQNMVSEVLGENFIYEIPPYQRPYAWTSHEALQLLEDLEEAAFADASEPYFLGSIVLIRAPNERVGRVVDGQQRLTTLTILAAVLRDIAIDAQEKSALSQIVYTEPNKFKGQIEAVRVIAHTEDRVFFREAVQVPGSTSGKDCPQLPKTDAQKLMWGNVVALRERLINMSAEVRQDIVTFLLTKCILVIVATDSRASALRIFKVLNDRGLDLSNSDIIKADLLDHFSDSSELAHQAARWRELETDLGRGDFENLLEHIRFIREKTRAKTTLSEAYAVRFKRCTAQDIRRFFDEELSPSKLWYTRIAECDTSPATTDGLTNYGGEALAGLNLLPNKDWTSLALLIFIKYGANEKSDICVQALEGLAWAMQLCRRYDTERLNRYATLMKLLEDNENAFLEGLKLTVFESHSAWAALSGPLYENFPTRVVRAILERLDRLLAEQPVRWDGEKSVEHILPQNPSPPDWKDFNEQERLDSTHKLGNLVLLTRRKNSSASNYDFSRKRDIYFGVGSGKASKRATYASVQELAHLQQWRAEEFSARHDRHLKLLSDHWGIDRSARIPALDELL